MIVQDDFSSTDDTVYGPKAFFANMPLSKTLTMNLDVPEPWLVEPVIAMYVLLSVSLMETFSYHYTLNLNSFILMHYATLFQTMYF